jgi:hypothetical protein
MHTGTLKHWPVTRRNTGVGNDHVEVVQSTHHMARWPGKFRTICEYDDMLLREAKSGLNYLPIEVKLADIGLLGRVAVRDLWARRDIGVETGTFAPLFNWHGARLFKLTPQ